MPVHGDYQRDYELFNWIKQLVNVPGLAHMVSCL